MHPRPAAESLGLDEWQRGLCRECELAFRWRSTSLNSDRPHCPSCKEPLRIARPPAGWTVLEIPRPADLWDWLRKRVRLRLKELYSHQSQTS